MATNRKPFQGVLNIIRFNWHFFVFSLGFVLLLIGATFYLSQPYLFFIKLLILGTIGSSLLSLLVSYYVYDYSNLYSLDWLKDLTITKGHTLANINAGFDETSTLIANKYRNQELLVFDFYDPIKHTEVSIKRARKAYPPYPNTQQISTTTFPLANASIDTIFAILSAHEIREEKERQAFFKELNRILRTDGQVIITEHLRDVYNFVAYNIGFLHFHSKDTWLRTFAQSGFTIKKELKITPFITTFILEKNGNTP